MDYTTIIDLGITLASTLVGTFTKAKAPVEVLAALQAAVDALMAHRDDVVNKANLEAQRGV